MMGTESHDARIAQGEAILERLKSAKPAIKKAGQPFVQVQKKLVSAGNTVETARVARESSLASVGSADDVLDESVLKFADVLVAAGLGSRIRPFAGFTSYAPSKLVELPYAVEAKEVLSLVAKVVAKKPDAQVKSAGARCVKNAKAVQAALAKLTGPQEALNRSRSDRDATIIEWEKARRTLERRAAAELDDDRAARALVASAKDVQAPKRRKRKVAKKPSAPATPAPASG